MAARRAAEPPRPPPPRRSEGASFRLVLEYDGSDFEGWQVQEGPHRTVQGVLLRALEQVTSRSARVVGAGRTNSGVHAEGQVASVRVDTRLEPAALLRALNAVLPSDLAVAAISRASDRFDARRCATSKVYRYRVWNAAVRSPMRDRWSLFVPRPLDLVAMRRAAEMLTGTHDFSSFRAAGSGVESSVRTLSRLEIRGEGGGEIVFEFEGDGFLRHMVRNLVGTLLEVGRGRREAASMGPLLASRNRSEAGPTAPARGLCLVRVVASDGHSS